MILSIFLVGCSMEGERLERRSGSGDLQTNAQRADADQNGPGVLPEGLVNGLWLTGECGSQGEIGQVSTTASEFKVQGLGEQSIAVGVNAEISMRVDFQLCAPSYYRRQIVFVVDTSGSMRSDQNTGSDPLSGGSCGRLDAVRGFLDALPEDNQVRVGFVTFSTDVDKDSGKLFSAKDFKSQYLNANSLCHKRLGVSGVDTNYTAGLGRAEQLLAGEPFEGDSREVYLLTDGLPGSAALDGRNEASRLKSSGILGTMMLGGTNDAYLKAVIATKLPGGSVLHSAASQASQMSSLLLDLIGSRKGSGSFSYLSDDDQDWVEFQLDPELDIFSASGILRPDFTGTLEIKIEDVDELGVERTRKGRLDVTRR